MAVAVNQAVIAVALDALVNTPLAFGDVLVRLCLKSAPMCQVVVATNPLLRLVDTAEPFQVLGSLVRLGSDLRSFFSFFSFFILGADLDRDLLATLPGNGRR